MHAASTVPTSFATAPQQARRTAWKEGGGPVVGDSAGGMTGDSPADRDDSTWDVISSTGPFLVSRGQARHTTPEQLFTDNYPKLAGWVRRLFYKQKTAYEIAS